MEPSTQKLSDDLTYTSLTRCSGVFETIRTFATKRSRTSLTEKKPRYYRPIPPHHQPQSILVTTPYPNAPYEPPHFSALFLLLPFHPSLVTLIPPRHLHSSSLHQTPILPTTANLTNPQPHSSLPDTPLSRSPHPRLNLPFIPNLAIVRLAPYMDRQRSVIRDIQRCLFVFSLATIFPLQKSPFLHPTTSRARFSEAKRRMRRRTGEQ